MKVHVVHNPICRNVCAPYIHIYILLYNYTYVCASSCTNFSNYSVDRFAPIHVLTSLPNIQNYVPIHEETSFIQILSYFCARKMLWKLWTKVPVFIPLCKVMYKHPSKQTFVRMFLIYIIIQTFLRVYIEMFCEYTNIYTNVCANVQTYLFVLNIFYHEQRHICIVTWKRLYIWIFLSSLINIPIYTYV